MLPGASACCLCGERNHTSSKCPTLHSPLTPGFYTGGGGGGGHSHDDEDETIKKSLSLFFSFYATGSFFNQYNTHYSSHTPAYTWSERLGNHGTACC
jgi:hypothetical protein